MNPNFARIGLSPIVEISERIRDVAPRWEGRTGERFAFLQRGELADPTPGFVVKAAKAAIDAGLTRYPKSGGEPFFKDAVIAHLAEMGITGIAREHVLCTYGGQEGLQLVFGLFAGGRVLAFAPTWSCVLENIFPYADFTLDTVALVERAGALEVDFAQLDRKLADADILYLNSPHNPTGKVFSRDELTRIDALCRQHGVRIVSDEAYKDFVYGDARHVTMLEFPGDHIFAVFTCSKSYAATGFRIGYTVCRDAELMQRLTLGEYTQTAGVVPFIQKAFAVALTARDDRDVWLRELLARFGRRRDLIFDRLRPVLGDHLYKPEGAFYFFLDLANRVAPAPTGTKPGDHLLQTFLDAGVAVIPGTAFGDDRYSHHVRLSFSGIEEEPLGKALDRITSQVLLQQARG